MRQLYNRRRTLKITPLQQATLGLNFLFSFVLLIKSFLYIDCFVRMSPTEQRLCQSLI